MQFWIKFALINSIEMLINVATHINKFRTQQKKLIHTSKLYNIWKNTNHVLVLYKIKWIRAFVSPRNNES